MEAQYIDFKNSLETHEEIKKSINPAGIIRGAILVIAGVIPLVMSLSMDSKAFSITTSLMCLGIALIAAGVWILFKQGSQWVHRPTGHPLRIGQIVLEREQMKNVVQAIEKGDFSQLNQTKENAMGGIKLDYAVTNEGSFGMVQMALYQGCTFAPASDAIVMKGGQAESLARLSSR